MPSLASRYTVRPEHMCSLPSMAPRYTVRPEHKTKPLNKRLDFFMSVE
ncbi:MAG: hypothetical protein JXR16_15970 [Bermanella sp.]